LNQNHKVSGNPKRLKYCVVGLELKQRSAPSSAGLKVMMSEVRSRVKTKVFSTAADIYGIDLRICQAAAAVFLLFLFACCLRARAFSFFSLQGRLRNQVERNRNVERCAIT
jgi:hypothetical protein